MSNSESPGIFVPPPLMFAAAVAAGVLIDGNVLEWRHIVQASQFAGLGVVSAGLVLIGVSLGLFRRFRTRPEPWQPSSALVTSGIYRFSRNPMYLGMALASAGIALFFESIAAGLLLAIVVAVIDRFVIQREERYLAGRFGAAYAAYRARVRRWL